MELESERWIGFGAIEGVLWITILCRADLREAMQLPEVMSFQGFGEISQELQEFSRGFVGQLERDTHDRQVIGFHGGVF